MSTTLLEWSPLWAAMDAKPLDWIPTTEAMYWHMAGLSLSVRPITTMRTVIRFTLVSNNRAMITLRGI